MANFYLERIVKDIFYRAMEENDLLEGVHATDLEKINDDKWLRRVLNHHHTNVMAAVQSIVKYCVARKDLEVHNKKYNVKQDKRFSKVIMPIGKDSEGVKVLYFDLTKIANSVDSEVNEHFIYWMERLHRQQENEKISFLFHHGTGKNMEQCPSLLTPIYDISSIYPGFVKSYFIIEDLLSQNCRRCLELLFGSRFTLIKESDMLSHVKLDEKFEIRGSSLKIRHTMKSKKEDSKSTEGEVKQLCGEIKANLESTAEHVQEKGVNNDQNKLKNILAELHIVENVVFKLIRNVQDLISEISYENLHQK